MFKIEWRDWNNKWRKMVSGRRYSTEALAWEAVGHLDPDGIIDRKLYRVRPAT